MADKPGWRWDDDWRHVAVMDWLVTAPRAREPRTRQGLADKLGVDVRTMRGWIDHPQFREEWQRRVTKLLGSPERAQAVMDTLYESATDVDNRNQVQAAKLYLEATNAIKPPPIEMTVKRPVDMTDDELDALIAQGAKEMRAEKHEAASGGSAEAENAPAVD
jgi:hypothetical protein